MRKARSLDQGLRGVIALRKAHQPFTSPDTDNAETLCVAAVNDSERRMNQFSESGLVELRNDSTSVWMRWQVFNEGDDLVHDTISDIRDLLLQIILADFFQISDR